MINKLIKRCKRDHFHQFFQQHSKNSKQIWNGINKLLKRSKKSKALLT